jgi:hypothetical protein
MPEIQRTNLEKSQFIQEVVFKDKNKKEILRIDGRDKERVDWESKKYVGREKRAYIM